MRIWTFWEPREKMPAYLQLCMRTWKKFLPKAEITVVDYSNMRDFVDVDVYGKALFDNNFRIDQIADAIRALLLEKYGGVWLDVDTIILNSSANKYFVARHTHTRGVDNDAVFFGHTIDRRAHLAFIKVQAHSKIMKYWIECVKDRLEFPMQSPPDKFFRYLGNGITNPYIKSRTDDEILLLDRRLVMPELESLPLDCKPREHKQSYQKFYFLQHKHLADLKFDMLMLHNSWAPDVVKVMNEIELKYFDCTLSNVLFEALGIDRSDIKEFLEFTAD